MTFEEFLERGSGGGIFEDDDEFFVNCNDLFFWGVADAQKITNEDMPVLEKNLEACNDDIEMASILFCAQKRKMRPQGTAYSIIPLKYWPLFDACGPERKAGPGNPHSQSDFK